MLSASGRSRSRLVAVLAEPPSKRMAPGESRGQPRDKKGPHLVNTNQINGLTGTQGFWTASHRLAGLLVAFGEHVTNQRCEVCGDSGDTSEERAPRFGRLVWLCPRCCVAETGYPPKNVGVDHSPEAAA